MRVHVVAFAMIAALFSAAPCEATSWPDHPLGSLSFQANDTLNTSRDPAITGRAVAIRSAELHPDPLGHVFYAQAPDFSDELVVAALPQPADAAEVVTRDIMVQVLRAAARARLATDDAVLDQMIATYLDEAADLTTGALPRADERPYITHEAEDAPDELTNSVPAESERPTSEGASALVIELPPTI